MRKKITACIILAVLLAGCVKRVDLDAGNPRDSLPVEKEKNQGAALMDEGKAGDALDAGEELPLPPSLPLDMPAN